MMRKLLSALIILGLLTGPTFSAQAGGGGPTLEEQVAKLEVKLKTTNARLQQLETKVKWYEQVVFPAKWEQINKTSSQLQYLDQFLANWLGQNAYKLDQVWAWWGQYQNVPDGIINDLNWLAGKLDELYDATSWFDYYEVSGLGQVVFVEAPVIFTNKTDHQDEAYFQDETWYKQTVHFQKGFDGSDPVTADNFSSQDFSYTWAIPALLEWAQPLMDVLYWYDDPNSGVDPYIEVQADIRTTGYAYLDGLIVNGSSTLNGQVYWIEWDEAANAIYHSVSKLLTWFKVWEPEGLDEEILVIGAEKQDGLVLIETLTGLNGFVSVADSIMLDAALHVDDLYVAGQILEDPVPTAVDE